MLCGMPGGLAGYPVYHCDPIHPIQYIVNFCIVQYVFVLFCLLLGFISLSAVALFALLNYCVDYCTKMGGGELEDCWIVLMPPTASSIYLKQVVDDYKVIALALPLLFILSLIAFLLVSGHWHWQPAISSPHRRWNIKQVDILAVRKEEAISHCQTASPFVWGSRCQ